MYSRLMKSLNEYEQQLSNKSLSNEEKNSRRQWIQSVVLQLKEMNENEIDLNKLKNLIILLGKTKFNDKAFGFYSTVKTVHDYASGAFDKEKLDLANALLTENAPLLPIENFSYSPFSHAFLDILTWGYQQALTLYYEKVLNSQLESKSNTYDLMANQIEQSKTLNLLEQKFISNNRDAIQDLGRGFSLEGMDVQSEDSPQTKLNKLKLFTATEQDLKKLGIKDTDSLETKLEKVKELPDNNPVLDAICNIHQAIHADLADACLDLTSKNRDLKMSNASGLVVWKKKDNRIYAEIRSDVWTLMNDTTYKMYYLETGNPSLCPLVEHPQDVGKDYAFISYDDKTKELACLNKDQNKLIKFKCYPTDVIAHTNDKPYQLETMPPSNDLLKEKVLYVKGQNDKLLYKLISEGITYEGQFTAADLGLSKFSSFESQELKPLLPKMLEITTQRKQTNQWVLVPFHFSPIFTAKATLDLTTKDGLLRPYISSCSIQSNCAEFKAPFTSLKYNEEMLKQSQAIGEMKQTVKNKYSKKELNQATLDNLGQDLAESLMNEILTKTQDQVFDSTQKIVWENQNGVQKAKIQIQFYTSFQNEVFIGLSADSGQPLQLGIFHQILPMKNFVGLKPIAEINAEVTLENINGNFVPKVESLLYHSEIPLNYSVSNQDNPCLSFDKLHESLIKEISEKTGFNYYGAANTLELMEEKQKDSLNIEIKIYSLRDNENNICCVIDNKLTKLTDEEYQKLKENHFMGAKELAEIAAIVQFNKQGVPELTYSNYTVKTDLNDFGITPKKAPSLDQEQEQKTSAKGPGLH